MRKVEKQFLWLLAVNVVFWTIVGVMTQKP